MYDISFTQQEIEYLKTIKSKLDNPKNDKGYYDGPEY